MAMFTMSQPESSNPSSFDNTHSSNSSFSNSSSLVLEVKIPDIFLLIIVAITMSKPESSNSSSFKYTYDVFLSFRGPDTRYGFTGHLYKALHDKGIRTFRDDEELEKGEEITPSLLKAIEGSRIALVVLSKKYAQSAFCLQELLKIHECVKQEGRLVLPIFYGVSPSDVRHLNGSYGEAFEKHETRFQNDKEKVKKWKQALHDVSNLSGWHLQGFEYESMFIKKIVEELSEKIHRDINERNIKLGNVHEGIPLMKEMLNKKKVLLILDDVLKKNYFPISPWRIPNHRMDAAIVEGQPLKEIMGIVGNIWKGRNEYVVEKDAPTQKVFTPAPANRPVPKLLGNSTGEKEEQPSKGNSTGDGFKQQLDFEDYLKGNDLEHLDIEIPPEQLNTNCDSIKKNVDKLDNNEEDEDSDEDPFATLNSLASEGSHLTSSNQPVQPIVAEKIQDAVSSLHEVLSQNLQAVVENPDSSEKLESSLQILKDTTDSDPSISVGFKTFIMDIAENFPSMVADLRKASTMEKDYQFLTRQKQELLDFGKFGERHRKSLLEKCRAWDDKISVLKAKISERQQELKQLEESRTVFESELQTVKTEEQELKQKGKKAIKKCKSINARLSLMESEYRAMSDLKMSTEAKWDNFRANLKCPFNKRNGEPLIAQRKKGQRNRSRCFSGRSRKKPRLEIGKSTTKWKRNPMHLRLSRQLLQQYEPVFRKGS